MAQLSLLDMVQNILSALDSDPVSSIDETVESVQVAELVREAYYDLMSQREWPFLRRLTSLQGLGDTTNPTKMRIPDGLNKIKWIKYDKKPVEYMEPEAFKHMIDTRTETVGVVDAGGFLLNKDPQYWTTYNDRDIVMDGRNSSTDNTLYESKTAVYGVAVADWRQDDDFVPIMPEKMFPTLLSEAKAQAFVNLKQQSNAREERKAQRGRVTLRNESWKNEKGEIKYNTRVNYGRK